jgi:uncharacterized membrane protein
MTAHAEPVEVKSQGAAYRLAALLAGSGVLHFVIPKPYDSIVPRQLPGDARAYTYVSGVAELAVAGALIAPRTRKPAALAAAALFIAVFPANVQMTVDWMTNPRISKPLKAASIARLPLQIPLVTSSLKAYRNAPAY